MDGTERVFVYPNLEPGQSLEVKVWDHSMPVLLQVGSLVLRMESAIGAI